MSTRGKFSIQFATPVWSQLGALSADQFDELLETLEYYAGLSAHRVSQGAPRSVEVAVPITAGELVAECTFDDFERRITLLAVVPCERPRLARQA